MKRLGKAWQFCQRMIGTVLWLCWNVSALENYELSSSLERLWCFVIVYGSTKGNNEKSEVQGLCVMGDLNGWVRAI